MWRQHSTTARGVAQCKDLSIPCPQDFSSSSLSTIEDSRVLLGYFSSSRIDLIKCIFCHHGEPDTLGSITMLQHRQLHRIFWTILCTAIYPTMPTLLCYSVYRSTAQWTVYLHRQELSVIYGQFCR